jgi:hypothetical protein
MWIRLLNSCIDCMVMALVLVLSAGMTLLWGL